MAVMYVKRANQIVLLVLFAIYVCFVTKPPKVGEFVAIGWPYFEMAPVY